jgi:hypothetical protein
MQRFIDKEYAKLVDEKCESSRIWYLPHFGVCNIDKAGKIRFVVDAAAKTS